jgi:endonuclease/exonuclease/phosphatase (EEP) superfamily protein YafD
VNATRLPGSLRLWGYAKAVMPRSSSHPRRSSLAGHRAAGILLGLVALAAAIVLGWPQLLDLQRAPLVAQAISFRLPVAIGATAILLLLLIPVLASRKARAVLGMTALVIALFVASTVAVLFDRGLGAPLAASDAPGSINILSWNTRGDAPGSPSIAELAVEVGADVVVLPETTEELGVEIAAQMSEAGSPMWVHTQTIDEDYKATSTTLLISPDLGDYEVVTDRGDTSTLPTVIAVPVDGSGPTIIAAHPVSPTPGNMEAWKADLEWLAAQCTSNTIVAGDFNSTLDHLSGLGESGASQLGSCADAALATGNGAVGTWTAGVPPLLGANIDRVMATPEWSVTGFEVVVSRDDAGSDHRPVFAQLSPSSLS